jgi:hypothetical protein
MRICAACKAEGRCRAHTTRQRNYIFVDAQDRCYCTSTTPPLSASIVDAYACVAKRSPFFLAVAANFFPSSASFWMTHLNSMSRFAYVISTLPPCNINRTPSRTPPPIRQHQAVTPLSLLSLLSLLRRPPPPPSAPCPRPRSCSGICLSCDPRCQPRQWFSVRVG